MPKIKLTSKDLLRVLAVLGHDETRIVGGAVRDLLLRRDFTDYDLATTRLPDEVTRLGEDSGWKVIPTGIDYGTVTLVTSSNSYQVTTLRSDVSSDGRHPSVVYGLDWESDALRRDFTMNALYADHTGKVYDYLGGIDALNSGDICFVGDAATRIEEDYLRILRFFRFFAYYGTGRPDADGLRACAKLKSGISNLSAERIWHELRLLFSAPDPHRALLWMRQSGVLSVVLPESDKWGIDSVTGLISATKKYDWSSDSLLVLMSIIPPTSDVVASVTSRLKLSNDDRDRLSDWVVAENVTPTISRRDLTELLYRHKGRGIIDRLFLGVATDESNRVKLVRRLNWALSWERPDFPLRGRDLMERGVKAGPRISELLNQAEEHWIDSDFKASKAKLLKLIFPSS